MMSKIRFGILGAGLISEDFANALVTGNSQSSMIVAVACSSEDKGKAFAKKFGFSTVFTKYEDIFNYDQVDVIYNGLVINRHIDLCIEAVRKKKHVICEKSMAVTFLGASRLVAEARLNGVFLMEAIWSRCMPSYDFVRQQIDAGAIGKIQHIQVAFQIPISHNERIRSRELGGGGMLDIGVYLVQFAFHVVPHHRLVKCHASGCLMPTGVDRCGNITMEFDNGVTAFLSYHTDHAQSLTEANVFGDKGYIKIPRIFWAPDVVIVNGEEHKFAPREEFNSLYHYGNSDHLRYEVAHVVECIRSGLKESPKLPLDESLAISSTITSIFRQIGVNHGIIE